MKYFIYCRKSTDEDQDKFSLFKHETELLEFAEKEGCEVLEILKRI